MARFLAAESVAIAPCAGSTSRTIPATPTPAPTYDRFQRTVRFGPAGDASADLMRKYSPVSSLMVRRCHRPYRHRRRSACRRRAVAGLKFRRPSGGVAHDLCHVVGCLLAVVLVRDGRAIVGAVGICRRGGPVMSPSGASSTRVMNVPPVVVRCTSTPSANDADCAT